MHEATGDEPSLVLDNGAALIPLHLVDPLQADQPAAHQWIYQLPCAIVLDGLHLFQHHPSPISVAFSHCERQWLLGTNKENL